MFPIMNNTNNWPPLTGLPVISFDKEWALRYDTYTMDLFQKLAKSGAWGSLFNSCKSHRGRMAASKENRADFKLYMAYQDGQRRGIHSIIDRWVNSPEGKKAIIRVTDNASRTLAHFMETEWNHWGDTGVNPRPGERQKTIDFEQVNALDGWIEKTGRLPGYKNFRKDVWPLFDKDELFYDPKDNAETLARGKAHQAFMKRGRDATIALQKALEGAAKAEAEAQLTPPKLLQMYIDAEKKRGRSIFTYIRSVEVWPQLMTELQFIVHVMSENHHSDIWERYAKASRGLRTPLNVNSYHRARYLGDFALLAYEEENGHVMDFYNEVEKISGGLLEDTVISTEPIERVRENAWVTTRVKKIIRGSTVPSDVVAALGDITCRIFVLNTPRVLVVAFKGTSEDLTKGPFNWTLNMDFLGADYADLKKGAHRTLKVASSGTWDKMQVHHGFLRAWLAVSDQVHAEVDRLHDKYKIQSTFVTGHSLGAAMATIATVSLPSTTTSDGELRPLCYTFASPRVGNDAFLNFFRANASEAVTVWIDGDIITAVPPFLVPSQKLYPADWATTLHRISDFAMKREKAFGLGIDIIGRAMGGNKLPRNLFPDTSLVYLPDGSIDMNQLAEIANTTASTLNEFTAVRGADSFMRLGWNDSSGFSFSETPNDPGNSKSTIIAMAKGLMEPEMLRERHALDNILNHLDAVVANHPDMFNPDSTNLPSWFDGGGGDVPYGPDAPVNPDIPPVKPKGKVIRGEIRRILERPGTTVVGVAHHKKRYATWSVVNKNDIDQAQVLYFPESGKEWLQQHDRAKKRHRANRKDTTYH